MANVFHLDSSYRDRSKNDNNPFDFIASQRQVSRWLGSSISVNPVQSHGSRSQAIKPEDWKSSISLESLIVPFTDFATYGANALEESNGGGITWPAPLLYVELLQTDGESSPNYIRSYDTPAASGALGGFPTTPRIHFILELQSDKHITDVALGDILFCIYKPLHKQVQRFDRSSVFGIKIYKQGSSGTLSTYGGLVPLIVDNDETDLELPVNPLLQVKATFEEFPYIRDSYYSNHTSDIYTTRI